MRFSVKMFPQAEDSLKLPKNYRKHLMSLIKEALNPKGNSTEFYERYFGAPKKNLQKPFTFSFHFSKPEKTVDEFFIVPPNPMEFVFSTNDYALLAAVYNGILKLRPDYPLFPFPLKFGGYFLLPPHEFSDSALRYKTVSPLIVRNFGQDQNLGFSKDSDLFQSALKQSLQSQCRTFGLGEVDFELKIEDAEEVIVPFSKNGKSFSLLANNAVLELSAPRGVHELVYGIGLGGRRSQGFGFLEILKGDCDE